MEQVLIARGRVLRLVLILLSLVLLIASAPAAFATPIQYTFEGTTTGDLAGRPFSSTPFTIVANADTDEIVHLTNNYGQKIYSVYATSTVSVAGIGNGRILDTTRMTSFQEQPVPVVGLVMGPHEAGGNLLVLGGQPFTGYLLDREFAPVLDDTSDEDLLIQTDFGPLLMFVESVTFRATVVPEPDGLILVGLIAGLSGVGRRRLGQPRR